MNPAKKPLVETQAEPYLEFQIFDKISKVMGDIGAVSKSKTNTLQNYKFRGIDDLYNALQPALIKHGVFCLPEVLSSAREERTAKNGGTLFISILTVKYTFYCADGSSVSATVIGEAMDSSDKATNKAMSAAQKYAFLQIFSIPTEEPKDSENDHFEPTPSEFSKTSEKVPLAPYEEDRKITEGQAKLFHVKTRGMTLDLHKQLLREFGVTTEIDLPMSRFNKVLERIEEMRK